MAESWRRLRIARAALLAVGALGLLLAVFLPRWWIGGLRLHDRRSTESAEHAYAQGPPACAPGSRRGPAPRADDERTAGGVAFSVRTPSNYDPTRAHPLIVVYAPRGADRFLAERFAGLTRQATSAGFLVAYADGVPLGLERIADLATIAERVAAKWCVAESRVFLTGHSDGGTAAEAVAFRRLGRIRPAAIAASGAGIRAEDLRSERCPPPLAVRVSHGRGDRLFPSYGAGVAAWWAECNGCEPSVVDLADGCREYPRCRAGARTLYCEHAGPHAAWPDSPDPILRYFSGIEREATAPDR